LSELDFCTVEVSFFSLDCFWLVPQAAKAKIAKAQLVRSMIFLDSFINWFLLY